MLSPKLAFFLYTFLDFFHLPGPPKSSTSLHINHKRSFKVVFNYVLCLLFELDFVKVYIASVFRQIEPHGQVGNNMDMDRFLLAQSNSLKKVVVK